MVTRLRVRVICLINAEVTALVLLQNVKLSKIREKGTEYYIYKISLLTVELHQTIFNIP